MTAKYQDYNYSSAHVSEERPNADGGRGLMINLHDVVTIKIS
jgi:hypothetical protein